MTRRYKWTFRLLLLTPLLLIIAVFAMGAGHGTYIPAMALFPFGMFGIIWQDSITFPFMIIAILQYPIYGFIIDKTFFAKRQKLIAFILLLSHILLAFLVIKFSGENWR